ncbi:MAG: SoxR reducing system RseC family protein [Bacteroidales bacterium]|nr:SoxR reducing system RseC family protein [Bacteroidales bacterium]
MGKVLVEHRGKVIEVLPHQVSVEILQQSACATCHAKSACMASDQEVKVVQVEPEFGVTYDIGEEVKVLLSQILGFKAVVFSYLIPLAILMILLLALPPVLHSDLWVGLACIGGIALYYLVLWMFKNRLKKEFVFTIEKIRL